MNFKTTNYSHEIYKCLDKQPGLLHGSLLKGAFTNGMGHFLKGGGGLFFERGRVFHDGGLSR